MRSAQPMVSYHVVATLPDRATVDRYLHWLTTDHVQKVLDAGALSATVVELESHGPLRVESTYLFSDPAAFARYLSDHAPRLRQEGLDHFGDVNGLSFERRQGTLILRAQRRVLPS